MASIINIETHTDERGSLNVIEDQIGFPVKRIFYIHGVPQNLERGGHGHYQCKMALVTIGGSCTLTVVNKSGESEFKLNDPGKVICLDVLDWHQMKDFTPGAVLLVLASENYDPKDYFNERPSYD
ncbi:MAG: FdtA/QdtA family cupin domain-containing protein [Halobacteriovoraceae bacterium]|jgi:hypothetical protein|nr:FdtA/QdtA family cupin domain-containing protein [Halobacteriovoraceae bacterium]MBT5095861.1 FdtA/QdtA family cupin domain-containing protein [Halobacteriovoraceae bacterium]